MKFAVAATTVASVLSLASAAPAKRTPAITDTEILQYALTLEHLENAFYSGALKKYNEGAFEHAGLPAFARGRFTEIAAHEAQHVSLLTGALGKDAVAPCTYKFPYTDPKSFAALSSILEGVGVSAYLGAAASISDKAYVTVAGSILTTESRHQAWISSAVGKAQPWSAPEDTPLSFNQVYTLAAAFITSCPSSNPKLPFTAFPAVTASPANAASGKTVTYKFTSKPSTTYYAVFYYGIAAPVVVQLDSHKTAKIPAGLKGTYYTLITDSNGAATDSNTVAGPLISVVNFPS